MSLSQEKESAIQNAFASILKCQHFLSYQIAQRLKKFNITRQQFEVLNILNEHYPDALNMNTVRDKMHETMPDISRIAHRMLEKGFINRIKQTYDKRNTEIQITEKGRTLVVDAKPVINSEMESFFKNLSEDDIHSLHEIISKLNTNNPV